MTTILFAVTCMTEDGYRITDQLAAYDEADAATKARRRVYANHNRRLASIKVVPA